MKAAEFLKHTILFAGLSDEEIARVLETSKERRFPAGEAIIEEGAAGRGFYLLIDGTAEVRKGDTKVAEFGPGDYFGEMSALHMDTPRSADVVATSDVTCIVVTSWDLRALLASHPEIGVRIMGELLRRVRAMTAAISD
jgi:CRP-like cAMP-binding protein